MFNCECAIAIYLCVEQNVNCLRLVFDKVRWEARSPDYSFMTKTQANGKHNYTFWRHACDCDTVTRAERGGHLCNRMSSVLRILSRKNYWDRCIWNGRILVRRATHNTTKPQLDENASLLSFQCEKNWIRIDAGNDNVIHIHLNWTHHFKFECNCTPQNQFMLDSAFGNCKWIVPFQLRVFLAISHTQICLQTSTINYITNWVT